MRVRAFLGAGWLAASIAAALGASTIGQAAPPTPAEIAQRCAGADDRAQCGRRIEEVQLSRFQNLAVREGDALTVAMMPGVSIVFRDSVALHGEKTYALWDFLEWINAVVLFTTDGERGGFMLVQRANGRSYRLPSEPMPSPDREHLVTADFCPTACDNEVVVWRVTRDDVKRELAWRPQPLWTDASVRWRDAETLVFDYSRPGVANPRPLVRRLSAPDWQRVN